MNRAAILSAIRTPVGRYGGTLSALRPDDLAAMAIKESVVRSEVDPATIDEVILGAANQAGEDNRNVARMAALLAGLPTTVAGSTVNRLCASGLEAILCAARAIECGAAEVIVAGGVESMSRAPFVIAKNSMAFDRRIESYDTTIGWRFTNPKLAAIHHPYSMGETAENIAQQWKINREEQDKFALLSQQRWAAAHQLELFNDEIFSIEIPQKKNKPILFSSDEHPRPNSSTETLSNLKPVFSKDEVGTVTAGNSSGINDGAAALVLMNEEKAKALGHTPIGFVGMGTSCGVDPSIMGTGPVESTKKLFKQSSLCLSDIGLIELNEAFAAQSIACLRELKLDPEQVNKRGGAIAIGHPLGMSGARLAVTLISQMNSDEISHGLATLCVGVGQGLSALFHKE